MMMIIIMEDIRDSESDDDESMIVIYSVDNATANRRKQTIFHINQHYADQFD